MSCGGLCDGSHADRVYALKGQFSSRVYLTLCYGGSLFFIFLFDFSVFAKCSVIYKSVYNTGSGTYAMPHLIRFR